MDILETLKQRATLITPPELAKLLNVSRSKIYEMAKSGELPHVRVGDSIRFSPTAIAAWYEKSVIHS